MSTIEELDQIGWWVVFLGLAELTFLIFGIVLALYKSATLPQPALLVMAVSLVTLVILTIYVITQDSDVLTLAGVPIGALVTASTGTFKDSNAEAQVVLAEVKKAIAATQEQTAAEVIDRIPGVTLEDAPEQKDEE